MESRATLASRRNSPSYPNRTGNDRVTRREGNANRHCVSDAGAAYAPRLFAHHEPDQRVLLADSAPYLLLALEALPLGLFAKTHLLSFFLGPPETPNGRSGAPPGGPRHPCTGLERTAPWAPTHGNTHARDSPTMATPPGIFVLIVPAHTPGHLFLWVVIDTKIILRGPVTCSNACGHLFRGFSDSELLIISSIMIFFVFKLPRAVLVYQKRRMGQCCTYIYLVANYQKP